MAGPARRGGRGERTSSTTEVGAGYRYVSVGLMFAGGILLFMGLGYALDRWVGTMPFGTVTGTLVGAVLSFLSVYRRLMADAAKEKQDAGRGTRR